MSWPAWKRRPRPSGSSRYPNGDVKTPLTGMISPPLPGAGGAWRKSGSAGAEGDENKADGERKHDEHPVLAVEAKKGKVLDQKVQRPRASVFRAQDKHSGFKNILFLYFRSGDAGASGVDLTFAPPNREFVMRMSNPKLH